MQKIASLSLSLSLCKPKLQSKKRKKKTEGKDQSQPKINQSNMSQKKHAIRRCSSKTNGKILVKSQTDPFDDLPDDILSSIISHFTARDAANASLLSSRWRNLCSSMSHLEFDWNTMFRTHGNCYSRHNINSSLHPCQEYKDRFVRGVNQFVHQYKEEGSQLDFFRVSLCLDSNSTADIDRWVSFAASKGVKQLHLCFSCVSWGTFSDRNLFILRSELLSHRNVTNIQRLFLCSCILGPGVMDHLSFLKSLTLGHMPLGQEGFENILSSCLSLESLKFLGVTLPLKLCISVSSPQHLKCLGILHCFELEEIELSSTSLTNFEYAGSMIKFSFLRVPNLEQVYFKAEDINCMGYVFSQLAKDLPSVKTLSVLPEDNWVPQLPKNMTTFNNIKLLEVFCKQDVELDLLRMMVILRSFPLLEKFHLRINCPVYFKQGAHEHTESFSNNLKEVHIGGFKYSRDSVEFLIYLLKYAISLKEMIIDPQLKIYIGADRWDIYNRKWHIGQHRELCKRLQGHSKSAAVVIK